MIKRVMTCLPYFLVGLFYFSSPLLSDDKSAKSEADSYYHIKKKSFQPELSLKGVIVPTEMEQIIIRLKEYNGPLTIKSITPSGVTVRKGAVLLSLDTDTISRQIRDAVYKHDKLKSDIEQAKIKMTTDKANYKKELDKAQFNSTNATEKLKNYKEIELPLAKDKEDLAIRRAEANLQDRQTELEQLEEMYKDSEIAGKTKEIVLERAKRDVEITTASLALEHRDADYNRQTIIPKKIEELTNNERWAKEELGLTNARATMELAVDKQTLNNLEFELQKHTEYLARLKADKDSFTITADKDGVVVQGNLLQRLLTWKAPSTQAFDEIKEGDTVKANETLFTLYSTDGYAVMTNMPEKFRYLVKSDNAAQIYINLIPDKIFKATISQIAPLVDAVNDLARTFSTRLILENTDVRLQAGATCEVQFELGKLENVITIPANSLVNKFGKTFVNLKNGDGTAEREVFVGAYGGDQAWITSGLKEGDVIVSKK